MVELVLGFALALGQCAAVGPVNLEALRRGIRGGFWRALEVEAGSILGDGLWALLALAGAGALAATEAAKAWSGLVGAVLLGWLAWRGWHEAIPAPEPGGEERLHGRRGFWVGALLAVVNPGSAAFWAGVGATLLATRLPERGRGALLLFALGYYAALLLWSVAFAGIVGQARRWLPPRYLRLAQRVLALLLGVLALVALAGFLQQVFLVPAE
jgi:chemosensory pili system protein ChpE